MLIGDFIEHYKYKTIALGGFDTKNTLVQYSKLLKSKLDIKYIVVQEKDSLLLKSKLPFITWAEIGNYNIDLVLVHETYTDSSFRRKLGENNIELLDINTVSIFEYRLNTLYPKVDKKMEEKNAKCIFFSVPSTNRLKNLSEREKLLRLNGNIFTDTNNALKVREAFDDLDYADDNYILELLNYSRNWERKFQGVSNYSDKYCNIIEGNRFVTDVPEEYNNTVYVFGGCVTRGILAEDKNTISSYLQRNLNNYQAKRYRVINIWNTISDDNILSWIDSLNIKSGDYFYSLLGGSRMFSNNFVSYITNRFSSFKNIIFKDLDIFESKELINGETFVDDQHRSHKGYRVMADEIYKTIIHCNEITTLDNEISMFQEIQEDKLESSSFDLYEKLEENIEFQNYIAELENLRKKNDFSNIGAVVVNCNPFTKGHRYLLEEASKKVDFLYIFVVEEDKSIFPFKDRLMLVDKATSDLNNVKVMPSGHFIISNYTFPGYFSKEDISPEVDTSFDVTIFSKYIAPKLGISTRFVGNEPNCQVTRTYNLAMKEILPKYNLKLCELKRMESNDTPISASLVRKLLQDCNFEKIREIVPDVTYDYLIDKYTK